MKKVIYLFVSILLISSTLLSVFPKSAFALTDIPTGQTLLQYGGRASVKIISKDGKVIYIDPYEGDYFEKADIVLITHEHQDHNAINKVTLKNDTTIIRAKDAIVDGNYKSFDVKGIKIEAVPAYNKNHPKGTGVGYILDVDGIKIYHAGDTSIIKEMKNLKDKNIDYALLPYDGQFNMEPEEMSKAAKLINAKHVIPIHGISRKPSEINLDNLLILNPKERIELIKS